MNKKQIKPEPLCGRCGAPAVDVWRGESLCRECLCPDFTASQLEAERIVHMTRTTGNLGREIGVARYEHIEARALCRAMDSALAKRGAAPRHDDRYILFGAAEVGA